MENKFDTDEQLRNSLRDFEAIPDSRSFDAILEKMHQKKKRRFFMIFFWTGLIALSGIAIPLALHVYNTEKPSALTMNDTHTASSSQHTAASPSPPVSTMQTHPQTHQASPSSLVNSSGSEATSPEAKAGATMPDNKQTNINASVNQISLTKQRSEKTSDEEKDKQNVSAAGNRPETTDKNNPEINAVEKADLFQTNTPKANQDIETVTVSVHPAEAMYMPIIQAPLPVDSIQADVTASLNEGSYPALFLAPEKKNTFSFYLGVQASPQLNSFAFSKNPNSDPAYHTPGTNFSDFYLDKKKGQSQFNFSVPFGIKAGVQINNTYEVFAGIGYQAFTEKEKLYAISPSTVTSIVDPGIAYNSAADFSVPYKNHFRYMSYSLEANRIFQTGKAIGFKLGLGLYGNQLINSTYVFALSPNTYAQTFRGREKLSPWTLTTKVKAGIIFNPNRRFQFHISPGFFYSPTSVFKKDYVIRQKPYGFDVECMMLFRLFKF
jgi:cytoskeletal protein RodZ